MTKLLIFGLLLIGSATFSQTTKKACFLGNSYTYVNDLPGLVANLATADGNELIHEQSTPGGYTLEGHSTNAVSLSRIAENTWDYVILQDQSQRPSFPWAQVQDEVFPYAEILVDSIRSNNECAIPLFYNTWGRRDGDDQWDSINTFVKMNQRLQHAYDYMGNVNSGKVSPVGVGFLHVYDDTDAPLTHTDLYSGDGSHPSIYGSYLAACLFYELIFDTDVSENTYLPGGIESETGSYLRSVAHHVLHDVDSIQTDYTQPIPDYAVSFDGLTATFTNLSQHSFTYFWDFGDGETSTEENPTHIYPDDNEYVVTLTAYYCGRSATINEPGTAGTPNEKEMKLRIYPNPSASGTFTLENISLEQGTIAIYSLDGQLVQEIVPNVEGNLQIQLEQKGTFIIRYGNYVGRLISL